MLKMCWPASLTMLNSQFIKFVDGWMVAGVSTDAFSAQYMGGMTSFIPEAFMIGLLTVVNTYVSQNFGAGRFRNTSRYAWAGISLAVVAAALMAPLAIFAPLIFGLLKHTPEIQALEVMYFRFMILSVCFTTSSRVLEQFFFGIHRPKIVLFSSILANSLNVLANYVLIFGKFGFPAMGLKGAAIGTVIAWVAQFLLLGSLFLSTKMHHKFGTRFIRTLRIRYSLQLLKLGWPAGTQLCSDIFCWTLFAGGLVGAYFGPIHLAASVTAIRYMGLSFMPAVGIGIATTALVGRYIGQGRPDLARHSAHTGLKIGMIYMGLCGVAFFIFRQPMVELFIKVAPKVGSDAPNPAEVAEIVRIGAKILIMAAVFQLFDAVGIVYVGALRGAGDTVWPMIVTIFMSWTVILGGGFGAVYFLPQLESLGPWLAGSIYVILLGFAMAWRFESGAWRKIDLLGRGRRVEPGPAVPGADATGIVPSRYQPMGQPTSAPDEKQVN